MEISARKIIELRLVDTIARGKKAGKPIGGELSWRLPK